MKLVTILLLLSFSYVAPASELECLGSSIEAVLEMNINVTNEQKVTNYILEQELIDAVKFNDLETLKELLANGADPNTIDRGRNGNRVKPIIFYALEREGLEVFKLLLSYGANAQVNKTANGVFNNNLLMVAFRKHARNQGKGKMSKLIKILLAGEFEIEDKKYTFTYNPYAIGGINNDRDAVSSIFKNSDNGNSLELLYTHAGIEPTNFLHKRGYIVGAAARGEVEFLNTYIEFNSERVTKSQAKKALEKLTLLNNEDGHRTVHLELIQRLREIAF